MPPPNAVALETTLLAHGVPRSAALGLFDDLAGDVRGSGGEPALVGVVQGEPVVGMTRGQLEGLLDDDPEKVNTANLGLALRRGRSAATTVATTCELAAAAGVRVFATGGLGGVHRGLATRLDISSDLAALARFPVAVVASGVKSILDVASTRELLETLGVPVVGFGTDDFPAFYLPRVPAGDGPGGAGGGGVSRVGVDARFDDAAALADFVGFELQRTGRGVVIANPIDETQAIEEQRWNAWLAEAGRRASGAAGRDSTPALLAALHEASGGATLRANIALVRGNARLAGRVAAALAGA